jgi:hypothetical protein
MIAKKLLDTSDEELENIKNIVSDENHRVLANISTFHEIDKERIKELRSKE